MIFKALVVLFLCAKVSYGSDYNSIWHYECNSGYCNRTLITSNTTTPLSFAECNILCLDSAAVWPKPTGHISVGNLTVIDVTAFSYTLAESDISPTVKAAFDVFTSKLLKTVPCRAFLRSQVDAVTVNITIDINDTSVSIFTFEVDESYTISSSLNDTSIVANIKSQTFFGVRHALETLAQLVVYDDLRNRTLFPSNVSVSDGPVYAWRGIMLDTARNFVTPKALKRTLDGMAATKLNTLHWHLTDTASFPYVSKSHPEMSEYGTYSPQKTYTDEIVRDVIEYARIRGIRVVPELDAPAHVGEGWQESGVLTCFNWKPWSSYCVEPPCGQLDPSRSEVYDILEDLYGDMLEQFGTEVFHMGGDEVNVGCWNATENLTNWMVNEQGWNVTADNFKSKVWPYFQNEAAKRLYKKAGKEIPIILWTSDLTSLSNVTAILPPSKYIIQVWEKSDDAALDTLLNQNYSIILSNYDVLYLDCGFAGWVTSGNNWCSPYKGWQLIYSNKPVNIVGTTKKSQVLGGETALWTEEAGTNSLDTRLWPRSSAFAEALWSEPSTGWEEAEERMLLHRNRLVDLGIDADELQPEWCIRNQQQCPINGKFNV